MQFIACCVLESNCWQQDQNSIGPCGPYPRLSPSAIHNCFDMHERSALVWKCIHPWSSISHVCVLIWNYVFLLMNSCCCAGYMVQGPEGSTNITVQNTTRSSGGSCYLSCPFNEPDDDDDNYYESQPCFYTVSVSEVIRGNYTVMWIRLII